MQVPKEATETVVTLTLQADGQTVSGEVQSDGSRYWATVDGRQFGAVGSLDAAIHRLAGRLRQETHNTANYGLSVYCSRVPWTLAFGTLAGPPGRGVANPCLTKALGKDAFQTLDEALQGAIRALAHCCN